MTYAPAKFEVAMSLWKVSLKILNSGIILKTFTHISTCCLGGQVYLYTQEVGAEMNSILLYPSCYRTCCRSARGHRIPSNWYYLLSLPYLKPNMACHNYGKCLCSQITIRNSASFKSSVQIHLYIVTYAFLYHFLSLIEIK